MRVAIYNQMFGLNGKSFVSTLTGHWAVHFQGNEKQIWNKVDLSRTCGIVEESNSDIIGICEVLEKQKEDFASMLKEFGYKWVYFGKGHKLKHHDMHVIEAVASKIPCEQINCGKWLVENRLGGGGGFVTLCFPKLKTTLFSVHLALSTRKYFYDQIRFISQKIENTDGRVILIGDFNLEYDNIKEYFPGLELASDKLKTCSITPVINYFYFKDVDHILTRGFEKKDSGSIIGYSDHKLIWADLE